MADNCADKSGMTVDDMNDMLRSPRTMLRAELVRVIRALDALDRDPAMAAGIAYGLYIRAGLQAAQAHAALV